MRAAYALFCMLAAGFLSACALSPPDIKEAWDGPLGTAQIEFEIKKTVFCDLRDAVHQAEHMQYENVSKKSGKVSSLKVFPAGWGAQISLLLQVDESTAINPGVALTTPFRNSIDHFSNGNVTTGQSFSFGIGGTASSVATRIDKFDPYYPISILEQDDTDTSVCKPQNDPFVKNHLIPASSSLLLQSDLGLQKWLTEAMVTNLLLPSVDPKSSTNKDAPDTISIEIKFVVTTSGNISPTWKLVRVTGNNGSLPLLSCGRTRTHDLLITIGPPNEKTRDSFLSSQIGQAVSSGNRSNQILQ